MATPPFTRYLPYANPDRNRMPVVFAEAKLQNFPLIYRNGHADVLHPTLRSPICIFFDLAIELYIPLHLAAEILGMEIKGKTRIQCLHGPAGSFAKVATQHSTKGNQVIVGVRQNGTHVDVSGMSDGTRDQLYLALRIASLEQRWCDYATYSGRRAD